MDAVAIGSIVGVLITIIITVFLIFKVLSLIKNTHSEN